MIVGHSMGGMLATHLSYMKPSLFKQLVLINPIGLEKYSDYVQIKDPQFFYEKELKKTEAGVRNYQKKNYYDGKWTDEYEKLLNIHIGWLNGQDKALIAWNNALTYMPIFTEDIVSKVKDLKVPTVLIIGTRDTTGPGRGWKKPDVNYKLGEYDKLGRAFIERFKNTKTELIELNGLGHLPQFESYSRFSEVFYPVFD
jgi:pimeloyl-ACP methyl ester carboxylesterase